MKLYEIIRITKMIHTDNSVTSIISVITATTDKYMAEKMLMIYKANCSDYEDYDIKIYTL